jgi:hypothetical protein
VFVIDICLFVVAISALIDHSFSGIGLIGRVDRPRRPRKHENTKKKFLKVFFVGSSCLRVFVAKDAADYPDAAGSRRRWQARYCGVGPAS